MAAGLLLACLPGPARAASPASALPVPRFAPAPLQDPVPDGAPADTAPTLVVEVLTAAPGDAIWERFGHNAIRILDRSAGTDVSYNWGLFNFSQAGFIPRLARGTMLYWMAPMDTEAMVRTYAAQGRDVYAQRLALTGDRARALQRALRVNALPENAYYRYDYYRDNCSTRVRDAVDAATGGAVRNALAGEPTGTTYRSHTRRLTQGVAWAYAGIQLVLSDRGDRPVDAWEEGFLPLRLREHLREVTVSDGRGGTRPLVAGESVLTRGARPPPPAAPASHLGRALLLGLGLAAVLLAVSVPAASGGALSRVVTAVLAGGWSALAGVVGTLLLLAWLFTDHVFWYGNENLLQVTPFHLALAALLLPVLAGRRPSRATVGLGAALAALSVLGLLLQALPAFDQVNGEVLAVTVPANVAVAAVLLRLRSSPREGPAPKAPPAAAAAA